MLKKKLWTLKGESIVALAPPEPPEPPPPEPPDPPVPVVVPPDLPEKVLPLLFSSAQEKVNNTALKTIDKTILKFFISINL